MTIIAVRHVKQRIKTVITVTNTSLLFIILRGFFVPLQHYHYQQATGQEAHFHLGFLESWKKNWDEWLKSAVSAGNFGFGKIPGEEVNNKQFCAFKCISTFLGGCSAGQDRKFTSKI